MKVDTYGLSDDQTIRRFVELPKLFELLIAERSFFPTLRTFQAIDPFECGIPTPHATRGMKRAALKDEASFLHRSLPEHYRTGDVVEDMKRHDKLLRRANVRALRQHVAEMRLMLMKSRVICNCWHLSDGESDAMWKLYGDGTGVMIVSSIGRLRAAIKGQYSSFVCSPNPQEYLIAPVQYVDDKDVAKLPRFYLDRPWLLKRTSFAHEREVRVSHELPWVIWDPNAGGVTVNLNPQKLVSEVVLSPFNPSWADHPLAAAIMIVARSKGINVNISRSVHMQPPSSKSEILGALEFLKLRDTLRGRRLRMEPLPDYRNLAPVNIKASSLSRRRSTKAKK
jgi:hypothetical protein